MDFSQKYKPGQKVILVVQGEGIYHVTIIKYDVICNRYVTNSCWYILSDNIVFEAEEELEEYKKHNEIYIHRGCSEFGYSRHDEW